MRDSNLSYLEIWRAAEGELKEAPGLSVTLLHLVPLDQVPLELAFEIIWQDQLLILVSKIVLIILTVCNSLLSTLISGNL